MHTNPRPQHQEPRPKLFPTELSWTRVLRMDIIIVYCPLSGSSSLSTYEWKQFKSSDLGTPLLLQPISITHYISNYTSTSPTCVGIYMSIHTPNHRQTLEFLTSHRWTSLAHTYACLQFWWCSVKADIEPLDHEITKRSDKPENQMNLPQEEKHFWSHK